MNPARLSVVGSGRLGGVQRELPPVGLHEPGFDSLLLKLSQDRQIQRRARGCTVETSPVALGRHRRSEFGQVLSRSASTSFPLEEPDLIVPTSEPAAPVAPDDDARVRALTE